MGDALLPYSSDLQEFQGQGIHLLQHIIETNEPSSSSALITLFLKWASLSQKHTELTDRFCSHVHDLANQMDHAGQPFTPELQMLFALRGLTSHFHPLYESFIMGTKDLKQYTWSSFMTELHNYDLSMKDRRSSPSSSSPSQSLCHDDLAWIGSINLSRSQSDHLVTLYKCPIHQSNDHGLECCHALQGKYEIKPSPKTIPFPLHPSQPPPSMPPTPTHPYT